METETEKVKFQVDESLLTGRWKLTYTLVNDKGLAGFSGRQIGPYTDPLTGRTRMLYNKDGQLMAGYFIQSIETIFNPAHNPWDKTVLDWLICHPEVYVEAKQTRISQKYMDKKDGNSRIKLINLDHQNVMELQEEDYIDKLVGVISLDSGVQALSREKLRFILSKIGMVYRYEKHIENPSVEKQMLRKSLKDYVRSSYENAQNVNRIIDDLDNAKRDYEIKEMVRTNVLNIENGMYKYQNNPLSMSTDGVKQYFNNNPDFYAELAKQLYERIQ